MAKKMPVMAWTGSQSYTVDDIVGLKSDLGKRVNHPEGWREKCVNGHGSVVNRLPSVVSKFAIGHQKKYHQALIRVQELPDEGTVRHLSEPYHSSDSFLSLQW